MAVTQKSKSSHHLLVFASRDANSLQQKVQKVKSYVEDHPERLPDVSHTLSRTAADGDHRTFAVADGSAQLTPSPPVERQSRPVVNFVFTGQGAQWPRMAADMFETYESFRQDVKRMDRFLQTLPHPPLWTIEDEVLRSTDKSRIYQSELSQPVCAALQIGLVNLLRSWGVKPAAVVGHSSGEIAAAYATGSLTQEEAITVAYYCGHVTQHRSGPGAMAAIGLGEDEVRSSYLADGVTIACVNSPNNTTISGDRDKVDAVIERVKAEQPDCVARRLRVERAFHSQHMRDIGEQYQKFLEGLVQGKGSPLPFYSTVTGAKIQGKDELGPVYWRENLERPVLFSQAIGKMLESSGDGALFLEVGPHSALEKPLKETVRAKGHERTTTYLPTLGRGSNGVKAVLTSLGRLFQERVDVDVASTTTGHDILKEVSI